jgi:hypothetical protein
MGRVLRSRVGTPDRAESSSTTRMEVVPRLLDLRGTATYLGVSEWTVRDLDAAGVLKRVRVPSRGGRELRKLLFDREDLDHLIPTWKSR